MAFRLWLDFSVSEVILNLEERLKAGWSLYNLAILAAVG